MSLPQGEVWEWDAQLARAEDHQVEEKTFYNDSLMIYMKYGGLQKSPADDPTSRIK